MNPPWPSRSTHDQHGLEAIARDSNMYDAERVNAVESIDDVGVLREIARTSISAVADAAEQRIDDLEGEWD